MFVSVLHPLRSAESVAKTVVLVLGMHRSGTSCAAGTLVRLGAAAPRHLMGPNSDNERGFWESRLIVDLNDAILAAGGSGWRDWRKFDVEAIDDKEGDALRARAKAALWEEFGLARLAVVKDPRMCRLMPFWAPLFEEARWLARALLPIRSPLEVAWSLNRRDGIRPAHGCLLWLRHVLDAEAETRGMARAVLDWPEFLGDRRKALRRVSGQLGLTWPLWHERALAEVDDFVSADLRHQRASEADLRAHPAVSDLARQVYAAMSGLVRDPGDSRILTELDRLRAEFLAASEIFERAIQEAEEEIGRVRSEAAAEAARIRSEAAAEIAQIRSQAASEIARADAMIGRVADRQSRQSTAGPRGFWRGREIGPEPSPNARDLAAIRNSLFFNSAHYLEANPDVRAAGLDPAFHYLVHGGREGRDPGPFFSTRAYLARYPDVAEAGLNALLHYEKLGRRESRTAAA